MTQPPLDEAPVSGEQGPQGPQGPSFTPPTTHVPEPGLTPRQLRALRRHQALEMEDVGTSRPATGFGRWMAIFAGMRPGLVDRFPQDRHIYIAFACLILATMLEAMVAGAFAIRQASVDPSGNSQVPTWIVVGFAIVWGFIILAIDRFIILGMDGLHGFRALILMLIRVLMAAILGFVLATPLVIQFLEPDLRETVVQIQMDRITQLQEEQNDFKTKTLNPAQKDLDDAQTELERLEGLRNPDVNNNPDVITARNNANTSAALCNELNQKAAQEQNGVLPVSEGGSGMQGCGVQCRDFLQAAQTQCSLADQDRQALERALSAAASPPSNLDDLIATATATRDAAQKRLDDVNATYAHYGEQISKAESGQSSGLLTHIQALGELTRTNSAARWAHWGIIAILMAIEVGPALFKGTRQCVHGWIDTDWLSPYEQACQDQDVATQNRLKVWEDEASKAWATDASLVPENADNMKAKQLGMQDDMNTEITLTQRVLMRRALRRWREDMASQWGSDMSTLEREVEEERAREAGRPRGNAPTGQDNTAADAAEPDTGLRPPTDEE